MQLLVVRSAVVPADVELKGLLASIIKTNNSPTLGLAGILGPTISKIHRDEGRVGCRNVGGSRETGGNITLPRQGPVQHQSLINSISLRIINLEINSWNIPRDILLRDILP